MESSASKLTAPPAPAAGARWRLAMPFALGLLVGAGIGATALFLPRADLPWEAHAAALPEAPAGARTAAALAAAVRPSEEPAEASPARVGKQADGRPRPAGLLGLGGPVERLPVAAPLAIEARRVWWKMPTLGAAPFAIGSAR
jgi:hypothetical protein